MDSVIRDIGLCSVRGWHVYMEAQDGLIGVLEVIIAVARWSVFDQVWDDLGFGVWMR